MTTLTITKARANLSKLLEKAKQGEDIGIVSGDQIVALRPVTVSSDDYAWREYEATPAELARFEKRMEQQISAERKRGKIKRYSPIHRDSRRLTDQWRKRVGNVRLNRKGQRPLTISGLIQKGRK